jgi:hypothetical protein
LLIFWRLDSCSIWLTLAGPFCSACRKTFSAACTRSPLAAPAPLSAALPLLAARTTAFARPLDLRLAFARGRFTSHGLGRGGSGSSRASRGNRTRATSTSLSGLLQARRKHFEDV